MAHRMSPSKRTLGIGLIGCGLIADESHLPAIKRIPNVRLVAVADNDESRAQLASQKYGAEHGYRDYANLLELKDVDAVDICTPTKYHADIAVAAAEAGKHVLCEKPIAPSLEDADRMIRASAENKVKLMIAHSRRFIPRYSIVREMIGQGRIGKPIWLTQISRRTVIEPSSWYLNPEMTLGPIAELGVHDADLLRWMLKDDAVEVRGIARYREENTRVYEQIFAALRFRRGTIGSFEVGYVLPKAFPQYTTLEVFGSQGLISASDRHMNVVTQGIEGSVAHPLAYSDLLSVNSAYEREILAFIESVINDTTPPVTGAEARAALEIILAVLQSIQTKKAVKLRPREAN